MKNFYAVVTDLFFMAKIQTTAKALGNTVIFLDSYETLLTKIQDKHPNALIVDLNSFLTIAHLRQLKTRYPEVKIIGYLNHTQFDLRKSAMTVCDKVYANSEFSAEIKKILE